MTIATRLGLVFALAAAMLAPEWATAQDAQADAPAPDGPVRAEEMMAVAANPHASRAGLEILREGGSAADAAIAMQMVLGLVEPQSSGIGGGGFLLHYDDADGETIAYDGRETAPQGVDETLFLDDEGEPMDFLEAAFGGRAVGVPGDLAMLKMVHDDQGKLPWARLFEPAIELAEKGFRISPRLHNLLERHAQLFRERDLSRAELGQAGTYFFTETLRAKPVGKRLKNRAYAASLKLIAHHGPEVFYDGPIGEDIVAAAQDNPFSQGALAMADMRGYAARRTEPVCGAYRDHRVCSMGPPSSGATTMLAILGILEGFDLAARDPNGAEAVHLFAEAGRLAYADRARYTADDDYVSVPVEGLIDSDYLAQRRQRIDTAQAMETVEAGDPPREHSRNFAPDRSREIPATSHLVAVDADGNVVSFTTTVQIAFGSFVMTRGFLLNNELTDFSFAPRRDGRPIANRVEAGKKPRSSMSPTIGFDPKGRVKFAVGSPGGSSIIPYVAKTVSGLLDYELDIQAAIELPNRVATGETVELESGTGLEEIAGELEAMGHPVEIEEMTSGLHGLVAHYGPEGEITHYTGGADPRREGVARGE